MIYSELAPGYQGNWPTVYTKAAASPSKERAMLKRCAADAAAWADAKGLPRLTGKPADVRAAEIYRAEWLRQKQYTPRRLRQESDASTWLMFLDAEMVDD